ncbi:hypothetical protein DMI62_19515 [Escherichia coli]|nr:hypothetical protein [Escherichia coli]
MSGLRQILSNKHQTAPVLALQPFGLSGLALLPFSRPLPFSGLFSFCWHNRQKNRQAAPEACQ